MSKYSRYFASDPDWENFMQRNPEYALKADSHQTILHPNVEEDRKTQTIEEGQWAKDHPLASYGYISRLDTAVARDGYKIPIKIYHPLKAKSREKLPLLFVTHGGGWVQGTFITEEQWLLYPILPAFELTIVSVDYRMAPEHKYPYYMNDCWDALQDTIKRCQEFEFDPARIYLAGSSAGGCLALSLAQLAFQTKLSVKGVIAQVPITCHPDYFPVDQYEYTSYDQCFGTLLASNLMRGIWDVVVPSQEDGKKPQVSPLLGDVRGLPPHLIFVAGQDPLRDEALAYVEKLEREGVNVKVHIYQGVPHTFAEIAELEMTKKFHQDLIVGVRELLELK